MIPNKPIRQVIGNPGIRLGKFTSYQAILDQLQLVKRRFLRCKTQSGQTRVLRSIFPKNNFCVEQKYSPEIDRPYEVSGFALHDDRELGIILHYHDRVPRRIRDVDWADLCLDIVQTLVHELIHFVQANKRKPIPLSYMSRDCTPEAYFNDPLEIDAYAHCAVFESIRKNGMLPAEQLWKLRDDTKTYDWFSLMYVTPKTRRRFIQQFFKWARKLQPT